MRFWRSTSIPVKTRRPLVRCAVLARVNNKPHRTRTRPTHDQITAVLPAPVSNPNSGSSINVVHVFPWVIPAFQSLLCYLLPSSYSQSSPPQFRGARGAFVGPGVSTHKSCLYVITNLFLLQTTDPCANVPWATHTFALLISIMTATLEYSIMATVKLSLCILFLFL